MNEVTCRAIALELERGIRGLTNAETKFLWCDLTFKVERAIRKKRVRKPARSPLIRNRPVFNLAEPHVKTYKIARIDDSHILSARCTQRRKSSSWKRAAQYNVQGTRPDYLPSNGPIVSVVRVVDFISRRLFKGRSRRKTNPERLICVVALHDRNEYGAPCRPHVHLIVALPNRVDLPDFLKVWRRAIRREPFAYRRAPVEPLRDLGSALRYIANPMKSSTGNPLVYHPPQRTRMENSLDGTTEKASHVAEHLECPAG
jgi:hypothetical protein